MAALTNDELSRELMAIAERLKSFEARVADDARNETVIDAGVSDRLDQGPKVGPVPRVFALGCYPVMSRDDVTVLDFLKAMKTAGEWMERLGELIGSLPRDYEFGRNRPPE
jgi:hypothetical protein